MSELKETLIAAKRRKRDYWVDLFNHKELFLILAKRDIAVRYKQTAIGASWSILRPLMTVLVTVFAFGRIAKLPSEPNTPYVIMAFSGILIWLFFSQMFSQISGSIVGGGNLVSKVYVPRLIIPLSSLAVGILDLLIGIALFIVVAIFYKFGIGWQVLFLPFFILLAYLCALAFGLFFATINVRYRDIAHLIPFIVQFGFFASPVAYSSTNLQSEWWYKYYNLNPIVGVIDGFRWCLLGGNAGFVWASFIPSICIITVVSFISFAYFRKEEDSFVDYL